MRSPHPRPSMPATYTAHGLPWFDLYDEGRGDITPSERLAGAPTIAAVDAERSGEAAGSESVEVPPAQVKRIVPHA